MGVESYILHYGYLVILLTTFFGGEEFLMLAGFLAHRGYLTFPLIVLSGFTGSLAADQLYFFLGRIKGRALLEKHPSWMTRAKRIRNLLHQHQNLVILLFRFVYGIRAVTPVLIGLSNIRPLKFFGLNALGAIMWAAALTALGYFFGQAAELLLGDVKKYEIIVVGFIIVVGLVIVFLEYRAGCKDNP
jgi:membrane protein DedA with SNARE-associated domain